jgi:hypothetical protein
MAAMNLARLFSTLILHSRACGSEDESIIKELGTKRNTLYFDAVFQQYNTGWIACFLELANEKAINLHVAYVKGGGVTERWVTKSGRRAGTAKQKVLTHGEAEFITTAAKGQPPVGRITQLYIPISARPLVGRHRPFILLDMVVIIVIIIVVIVARRQGTGTRQGE